MTRAWRTTGHTQRVGEFRDRIPPYDERSGEHLWVVITMYRVVPAQWRDPAVTPMLDNENLLSVQGPACFHCERAYTEQLAKRRCPGDPK